MPRYKVAGFRRVITAIIAMLGDVRVRQFRLNPNPGANRGKILSQPFVPANEINDAPAILTGNVFKLIRAPSLYLPGDELLKAFHSLDHFMAVTVFAAQQMSVPRHETIPGIADESEFEQTIIDRRWQA